MLRRRHRQGWSGSELSIAAVKSVMIGGVRYASNVEMALMPLSSLLLLLLSLLSLLLLPQPLFSCFGW